MDLSSEADILYKEQQRATVASSYQHWLTRCSYTRQYTVVVNREEQYSLWPGQKTLPLDWKPVDQSGSKEQYLAYIKELLAGMTPLGVRKRMASS